MSWQWSELLKEYESAHAIRGEIDSGHEVQRRLCQIFSEREEMAVKKDPTLELIPRFYFPKRTVSTLAVHHPGSPSEKTGELPSGGSQGNEGNEISTAQRLLRKISRTRSLQRKSSEVLIEDDLRNIYEALGRNNSPPFVSQPHEDGLTEHEYSGRINYDDFCTVREELASHLGHVFTPRVFSKFRRDEWGRISVQFFFQYVCRIVNLQRNRIQLYVYDTHGDGCLREQDLENYIYELIPSLHALVDLQENFYPFYVFTAVRKFFFFLDPKHTCKIPIRDLVTSSILHELLHLQTYNDEMDREEADQFNWFSSHNTLRVYSQYLELDVDRNGMLSRSEIAGYGTGSLTTVLLDRVFEECLTYEGEMDYKTFLDFVLAMETKKSAQSLAYFFRLLDIKKSGYLDRFTINYFFREIVQRLRELDGGASGGDTVQVDDVTDEIFDMCKPAHPARISLQDLIECGVGDTIVTMLTDLSGFWAYDNREHLIAEEAKEERREYET
uniref:Serine/threonine-protein phosphatase 2A regulatory subunit B'' subunit gamma n=1 Tax=Mucochytrium quahogii TaxID=96639 RepID=A0A7S2R8D6_9STRA|mmetsp:Transcript_18925/g.30935  ORF Transcript_18925/g.30935 Transcript_18925/m.30935 type:complete len:499 (+) Transcript_18925:2-1498(+)